MSWLTFYNLEKLTNLNFGFFQPGPLAEELCPDLGVQRGRQRARRRRGRRGEGRHRHPLDVVCVGNRGGRRVMESEKVETNSWQKFYENMTYSVDKPEMS